MMGFPFSPLIGFRSEKAAQIAAYFLAASGGELDKLALIKLIYISERESVRARGRVMIYDEYYSMRNGPICSSTLDAIDGDIDKEIWSRYIHKGKGHKICVNDNLDLDQLSISDIRVMEGVLDAHKGKTAAQLRNWTHDHCPEYTEVSSGRVPIVLDRMAEAVDNAHPEEVLREAYIYRKLESILPRE